jgi:hypothetical protein
MRAINRITDKEQDSVINFSIDTARKVSWKNALFLAQADSDTKKNHIKRMDRDVVCLADRIKNPGFFLSLLLAVIRIRETKSVPAVIDILIK